VEIIAGMLFNGRALLVKIMKCILGKKIGMTQVFLPSGDVVPVTKIKAGPCQITQVKDKAIQLGFDEVKEFRLNKPQLGHLQGLRPVRILKEISVTEGNKFHRGDEVALDTFVVGDRVNVTGISKGRGFAGVVKRHHFAGGPASHGHKDNLRAPGSIGVGGVQKVFKGLRMAGHMGDAQVTVKNLEVVELDLEKNEILIKGAIPGGRRAEVVICAPGELKIKEVEVKSEVENKPQDAEANVEEVNKEAEKPEEKPVEQEVVVQEAPQENNDKKEEEAPAEKPEASDAPSTDK